MRHHDRPAPDTHTVELLARILAIEEEKDRLTSLVARLEEQLDTACHALCRALFSASDVAETERVLLARIAALESENERVTARCLEIER